MSPEYNIIVLNQYSDPQYYYLICAAYSAANSSGSSSSSSDGHQAFTNSNGQGILPQHCVYQTSGLVATPHGSVTFPVKGNFVAVCGTAKQKLGAHVRAFASDWTAAKPANVGAKADRVVMSMKENEEAKLKLAAEQIGAEEEPGQWVIQVDKTFEVGNPREPFVGFGLAKPYHEEIMMPLVIWKANPEDVHKIHCEHKWFVAVGRADVHEVVVTKDVKLSPLIDFSGKSSRTAKVIHKPDNSFSVQYF